MVTLGTTGLASKEDFSAVQLRKNSANLSPPKGVGRELRPYKEGEVMLIQVNIFILYIVTVQYLLDIITLQVSCNPNSYTR